MKIEQMHSWDVSPREAVAIQESLRERLTFGKLTKPVSFVAGTDVSFSKQTHTLWAGALVFSYPELERMEEAWVSGKAGFPYVPGLLSFREIPYILKCLSKLEIRPQVILCDGQGIAHPRHMGLAAHLGILTQSPTVGCAKKRLVGQFMEPGPERGDYTFLYHEGEAVGVVVRTKSRVKPLFVSPGYGVTIQEALRLTLACSRGYRLVEPVRQAHLLVNQLRKQQGWD